ncbi:SEC14-like protein 4 [Uloborus diversus]|uniref:SEC14-like protein 4 n=1 Tax=Uloborus diversus TaxID=327109 RepID=UPI002409F0C6|nr:SEC14-like protein 4 [Uloborus diversus]XP_054708583.1 SEC14-like protein 4 [Uloborus diversus]XP_054708584.1 SEC14-like protein 4 [Uloborus diversus]XP_054708585.1 SEC14-like protein 4 [Uloborus diversus]
MSTGQVTENRSEKIQEFRERVLDVLNEENDSDAYLVKWLIARNFDVDQAEEMLRKHIKFMTVNGLDKIGEDFTPPEVTKYFHSAHLGYDKEGSVVRILHIGGSDLRGLVASLSKLDSIRYATYVLRTDVLRQKRERANQPICDKFVYIIDLEGLSWRAIIQRIVIERAMMLLKIYEANYPENLKIAYIFNSPTFFSFIYNWLKSFLPESILTKLDILTPEECSKLFKTIDPSIIPASLGGARRDPEGDPHCQTLYHYPLNAEVPESMMLYNQLDVLNNDPTAEKAVVDYRSYFKVEVVIKEPNSTIQWDFQTLYYDIRMGLSCRKEENSESEVIIPLHRVDSNLIPESGEFTCPDPGIYEIIFDNTYSWMTRKELIYKISVRLPGDNPEN